MYLWYLHACQVRVTVNVPLVQFMYLVFTRMPGESYCGNIPLMEFMYLVFTRIPGESYCGCTSGGVYVPCIYTHARWELLWMYLWWSLCTLYLHACLVRVTVDVPLVEFMYLVFTRMPGESYCRRLRSLLLCLCDVFRMLINSLICWFCTSALGLVLFQICMLVSYSNLPTG